MCRGRRRRRRGCRGGRCRRLSRGAVSWCRGAVPWRGAVASRRPWRGRAMPRWRPRYAFTPCLRCAPTPCPWYAFTPCLRCAPTPRPRYAPTPRPPPLPDRAVPLTARRHGPCLPADLHRRCGGGTTPTKQALGGVRRQPSARTAMAVAHGPYGGVADRLRRDGRRDRRVAGRRRPGARRPRGHGPLGARGGSSAWSHRRLTVRRRQRGRRGGPGGALRCYLHAAGQQTTLLTDVQ